jgi:AcrR family transcriptional regulator
MRALPGRASGSIAAPVSRDDLGEDQQRRIRRATGELVAKRGYSAVSVDLIVKRAQVSPKTFYKHFASKEEAFTSLFDATIAEMRQQVRTAVEAEPEATWPRLLIITVQVLFGTVLADPLLSRAIVVEGPTAGPVIGARYQGTINELAALLRGGRAYDGRALNLPETLEETLAGGVLWSAYERLVAGEVERIEELLPEAIEFLLRPYLGPAEASRWAASTQVQS